MGKFHRNPHMDSLPALLASLALELSQFVVTEWALPAGRVHRLPLKVRPLSRPALAK